MHSDVLSGEGAKGSQEWHKPPVCVTYAFITCLFISLTSYIGHTVGPSLSTLQILIPLVRRPNKISSIIYSHFTGGKTEAQKVIYPDRSG